MEEMSAGRAIDILVASKVMGWENLQDFYNCTVGKPPDGVGYKPIPRYSTDIVAAWEVIENMKGRKIYRYPVCPNIVYYHSLELWSCELFSGDWMRNAKAETVQLAICKAALLAIESLEERSKRNVLQR